MTLNELFKVPPEFKSMADYLESLNDDELKAHFDPFLNVTRPERASKEVNNTSSPRSKSTSVTNSEKYQQARLLAEQFGIKI